MSDDEKPDGTEEAKPSYPRKYWWIILVALPVAIALIGILPQFFPPKKSNGGGSRQQNGNNNMMIDGNNNTVNNQTYVVINMPAIEKEYATLKGEPLPDGELKKQIETANALLKEGKAAESVVAYEKINQKLSLPSLQTNLGVAYEKAGKTTEAEQTFAKVLAEDPGYTAAQQNLDSLSMSRGELIEAEPNNEPSQANILPLEKAVAGNIPKETDTDFYRITTPGKYRDMLSVAVENRSMTLRPGLQIFDGKKSLHSQTRNETPGANLEHTFSVPADATFYVQVYADYHTSGLYKMTAKPLKKYDAFEPNEDILHAASIETGREISGDIMEDGDSDFYKLKAGAHGAKMKVHIENQSTTLRPGVRIFDGSKSNLSGNRNETPGANLDHSFAVEPEATYFVNVYGDYHTSGSYTFTLTQE